MDTSKIVLGASLLWTSIQSRVGGVVRMCGEDGGWWLHKINVTSFFMQEKLA